MNARVLNDHMQVFNQITTAFGVHFPGYTVSLVQWEDAFIGQVHLLDKWGDIRNVTARVSKKEVENNMIDKAILLATRVEEATKRFLRELEIDNLKLSDCTPVPFKLAKALSDGKTPQRTS